MFIYRNIITYFVGFYQLLYCTKVFLSVCNILWGVRFGVVLLCRDWCALKQWWGKSLALGCLIRHGLFAQNCQSHKILRRATFSASGEGFSQCDFILLCVGPAAANIASITDSAQTNCESSQPQWQAILHKQFAKAINRSDKRLRTSQLREQSHDVTNKFHHTKAFAASGEGGLPRIFLILTHTTKVGKTDEA